MTASSMWNVECVVAVVVVVVAAVVFALFSCCSLEALLLLLPLVLSLFCRVCHRYVPKHARWCNTPPWEFFFFPNTWFSPQRGKFKTKQRNSQATRLRKNLSDEIFPNPPSWLCASNPPWFCGKSAHKVFPGSLFVIRRVIPGTWYGVCCHGWSKSTLLEPRWIRIWQIIDSRLMI